MTAHTYRVEAHDGSRWSFGVRMNDNSRLPEFCSLTFADHFGTRAEATVLAMQAKRLCGGTLRVAMVRDDA
jgi:hypothetical protein